MGGKLGRSKGVRARRAREQKAEFEADKAGLAEVQAKVQDWRNQIDATKTTKQLKELTSGKKFQKFLKKYGLEKKSDYDHVFKITSRMAKLLEKNTTAKAAMGQLMGFITANTNDAQGAEAKKLREMPKRKTTE